MTYNTVYERSESLIEEKPMREILFRGKQKGKQNWLFGSLIKSAEGKWFIVSYKKTIHLIGMDLANGDVYFEVDPSTIGQFIGLDKVWQHDLVGHTTDKNPVGFIDWSDAFNGWAMFTLKGNYVRPIPERKYWGETSPHSSEGWIIVGNIHDNPELLKEPRSEEII